VQHVHESYEPVEPYDRMFRDPPKANPFDLRCITTLDRYRNGEIELSPDELDHVVALYDGEIAYADSQIGRLLYELEKRELLQDALVIITADHGEELFERGDIGHGPTLYEEVLRVPLIMWQKQSERPGATVDSHVTLLDIVPTVLSVCGIQSRGTLRGKPLLPPAEEVGSDMVWAEVDEDTLYVAHKRALVWNNWKIITSPSGRELYDILAGPHEMNYLSGTNQKLVESLASKADEFSGKLQQRTAVEIKLDDRRLRELQSLGYVSQTQP